MKKAIPLFLLSAMSLSATAQKALYENKFFDNWSVGLRGGAATPAAHSAFFGGARPVYGVEVGKQLTPVFGLGFQGMAGNNHTESRNVVDVLTTSITGKINLHNLFATYAGRPRFFEVEAVVGAGWLHYFNNSGVGLDDNSFSSRYGLNFNFNLGSLRAWTVTVQPAIVYDMKKSSGGVQMNVNRAAVELTAGAIYHFRTSNSANYMRYARLYDQAEVDGLNAKVNDLRSLLADKQAQMENARVQLDAALAENEELQHEVETLRGRGPIVETVTHTRQTMESVVTFRQGKTTVDASQLPNVERIATYMRNHARSKVSIKGYASPEGSAEVNARIAKARAEAVKTILISKYGIAASRITAEGQGVGNMFSEPDWNRVSICTLDGEK